MKICLYSSYSQATSIANYVKDYLLKLSPFHDKIIFITNERSINERDLEFLRNQQIDLLMVVNEGHDFGMYYKALCKMNCDDITELALINDSCIPVNSFDAVFKWFRSGDLDYGSLTDCYHKDYYLQSYFLLVKGPALKLLYDYFMANKLQKIFADVVRVYESGLTQHLIINGCKASACYSAKVYNSDFIELDCALELIENGFPLIKKKLLTKSLRHFQRYRLENIDFDFNFDYRQFLSPRVSDIDFLLEGIHGNKELPRTPLVSILYNSSSDSSYQSIQQQTYSNLESISFTEDSLLTSINSTKGEYIFILAASSTLEPNALYHFIATALDSNAELLYSDETKINQANKILGFQMKPDYNAEMLLSFNYIGDSFIFHKKLLRHKLPVSTADLLLQLCESSEKVYHISKPLIKKRVTDKANLSLLRQINNCFDMSPKKHQQYKDAVTKSLKRQKLNADVLDGPYSGILRVKRVIDNTPKVSIIIHTVIFAKSLQRCLDAIHQKTNYPNYEILIASDDKLISDHNKNVYSSLETCVHHANGEHLLFINCEAEVISENWLSSMLEHSQKNNIAAVGAKLIFPDTTIAQTYINISLFNFLGDPNKFVKNSTKGYCFNPHLIQHVSAVSSACWMVKKELLNKRSFHHEFNLHLQFIHLNLTFLDQGLLNTFTPYSELYLHSPMTSDHSNTSKEIEEFKSIHKNRFELADPFYNSSLNPHSPFNPPGWSFKYGAATGSEKLLTEGLKNLYTKIGRESKLKLAIFGGGQHTQRLLEIAELKPHSIEFIVDDNPSEKTIANIPVKNCKALQEKNIDAIIISSDTIEQKLINRLLELNLSNIKIIALYSDILLEV